MPHIAKPPSESVCQGAGAKQRRSHVLVVVFWKGFRTSGRVLDRGFGPIGAADKGFRPKFSWALRAEKRFLRFWMGFGPGESTCYHDKAANIALRTRV